VGKERQTGLRDALDVVAGEDDLILDLLGASNLDAWGHLDDASHLLAEEVVDADLCLVLRDGAVDGEVSVDKAHLVLKALGDAGDHVADVCDDRADRRDLLPLAKPHLHLDALLRRFPFQTDVQVPHVFEVPHQ